ncbi:MAG: sulfatase-like hydrolase/transferase [Thermoleophilaceae bacterium]|nr:sulfatase-like hydrolase/transferase [Thermoleophilaceae bacterium]
MISRALAAVVLLVAGLGLAAATGSDGQAAARRPHVVVLVLDEFPGDSLLGPRGRIDPVRYPNFAALAGDSTWFRNAYSVYDSTTKAVPLILDGRLPREGSEADTRYHPQSIFTALARRGYRTVSREEATAICPPRLCRGAPARRPAILPRLGHGREERFGRFLRLLRPSRRPTLWMHHALLPHGPYLYLPSGARTRATARDLVGGMNGVPGFHDTFLTRHNEQRYLLQLGFVDRLIGRLIRRLKAKGIYDRSLVVVTADHGISWRPGVETRRSVSPANVDELTPVPLIVKRPGQRRGRVSDAYARTLDVAPTIAAVLGVPLGYRADGRSAFGRAARRSRTVRLTTRDFGSVVRISGRRWEARRHAIVRRRLREFGWGDRGLYTGIGPNRGVLGRSTAGLARAAATSVRATIADEAVLRRVRRASGVVPAQVAGDVRGGRPGGRRAIAVAVDGRIEAVGWSFHLDGDPVEHYSVMVPEAAIHDGHNRVEVFEVVGDGAIRPLARS